MAPSPVKQFRYITLPLLRRTLLFSAVIAIINAVQVFEPVALITQGGPVGSTNVLTYHIRRVGIERAQGGFGSAMAVMLMLSLIVVVVALFAFANRKDERMNEDESASAAPQALNWPAAHLPSPCFLSPSAQPSRCCGWC